MKTTKKVVGIFLISLFILSSCGKYEDGPKISVLPKSVRLAGTWTVEKLLYDGLDNEIGFALVKDMELTLESDGTGSISMWGFDGIVEWELTSKKENFSIRINMGGGWDAWGESNILRLTNKEFWVSETATDGTGIHTIETHYVKQ